MDTGHDILNLWGFSIKDPQQGYLVIHLMLVLASLLVVIILKILNAVLEPYNYELDMTCGKYCKNLAEIDNNLRVKHNQIEQSQPNSDGSNQWRAAFDCASGLFAGQTNVGPYSRTYPNLPWDTQQTQHTIDDGNDQIYPNGWIPVIESLKVKPGTVKRAIVFGKDVIVTRSLDGQEVGVLDAYCPHMGVHIGIGGKVRQVDKQSCVQCPFHGWTFRSSDGQCVDIPYQKSGQKCNNIPKQARLKAWISTEVDNFIYVWHHVDDQPPEWKLKPSEQLTSNKWTLAGRSCHKSNLDIQDMHQNGADMNHFDGIHNDLFIFGGLITKLGPLAYLKDYFRHHYRPEWRPVIDQVTGKSTHMAEMKLKSWISIFQLEVFDITIRAYQIGPACVKLHYNSTWYGRGLLTMNAVPLGGRRIDYIQHIYTERTLFNCFMAKWVLYGEIQMLERDLLIWNHKKNLRNPILIPEDKALKQFRLWYSQFFKRKKRILLERTNLF